MSQAPANSTSPWILGYFFQFGLYGVLSSQVYLYYLSFPSDKWSIKVLSVLNTYDAVVAFASDFGNINALAEGHLSFLAAPILTGAIALIVQMFYAFRIYVLTKTRIFPLLIATLSVMQCSSGFVSGILEVPIGNLLEIPHYKRMTFTEGGWVITSGVCDMIIAMCMWYQVYDYSKNGISRKTQSLLVRVVRLIIGTGAMTATVAVVAAVLFARNPSGVTYTTPCVILAQLYSNSMLVVLNNRLRLKETHKLTGSTLATDDIELRSSVVFNRRAKELESQS
ncbi:hypothetical protein BDQ17DRAFT_1350094 [Cyathus striatus]|nr:hypothetical protein BDQ17DRAFT_1350094 [Cyathus striatus]